MRPRAAAAWLALLACACANEPADPYKLDAPRSGAGVGIAPYAMYEECFSLSGGEGIDYYFASTAPVAFNIHYHDANAVVLPVSHEHTTFEAGDFVADHKEVYCMMWEAGAEPALIDYRVRARR